MEEVWRDVNGFSNYKVSNTGLVKRCEMTAVYYRQSEKYGWKDNKAETHYPEIILKPCLKIGYGKDPVVRLRNSKGVYVFRKVCRLVSESFLGTSNVKHKDGNRWNNSVENLEVENGKQQYYIYKK
jgi:hypothetical protein